MECLLWQALQKMEMNKGIPGIAGGLSIPGRFQPERYGY